MLFLHMSDGCFGCPFFYYRHVVVRDECKGEVPVCNLDGMIPVSAPPLSVHIDNPNVSPDTCPLLELFGTGIEVQRG